MIKVHGQFLLGVVVGAAGLALLAFGHGWMIDRGTANGSQTYPLLLFPFVAALVASIAWSTSP